MEQWSGSGQSQSAQQLSQAAPSAQTRLWGLDFLRLLVVPISTAIARRPGHVSGTPLDDVMLLHIKKGFPMLPRLTIAGAFAASLLVNPAFAEEEKQTWRLFIADHTAPIVRSFDVKTGDEIGEFGLKGYAALAASHSGQTVFAVQSEANAVQVIKTGVTLSDHGDHRDLETSTPSLLQATLDGKRPVHAVMATTWYCSTIGKAKPSSFPKKVFWTAQHPKRS
jgi:hypothetical protein